LELFTVYISPFFIYLVLLILKFPSYFTIRYTTVFTFGYKYLEMYSIYNPSHIYPSCHFMRPLSCYECDNCPLQHSSVLPSVVMTKGVNNGKYQLDMFNSVIHCFSVEMLHFEFR